MASEQFILEMHKKLHPGSDIHDTEDLTGHEMNVIAGIIDDKHSIAMSSHWIPDKVRVDLKTLRNVLTSATLGCHDKLNELYAQTVSSMDDGRGSIDPNEVQKWEAGVTYYQDQLDAIKIIEIGLLDVLREETNKDGFYMREVI